MQAASLGHVPKSNFDKREIRPCYLILAIPGTASGTYITLRSETDGRERRGEGGGG